MYRTQIIKDGETGVVKQSTRIIKPIKPSPNDKYIEVKPNDTLSSLAKKYYGSDKLWRVIAFANKITTNNPKIGSTIRIPSNPEIQYEEE